MGHNSKIISLSQLPDFSNATFDLIPNLHLRLCRTVQYCFSGLLTDPEFIQIVKIYESHGYSLIPLSSHIPSYVLDNPIYILGLENQWVRDIVQERFVLNLLRTSANVPVTLVHITERFGRSTSPSLVFQDT